LTRLPNGWRSGKPAFLPDAELLRIRIGRGERDAIPLAQETGADDIILDDQLGRREAQRRKLHAVGTLGVLRAASKEGFLNLREALARLAGTNFCRWVSASLR
jgi:predicted nucleic acid-binding protein